MKKLTQHIIFVLFVLSSVIANAQKSSIQGYKIEGDEVVFTFNKDDYKRLSHDNGTYQTDFKDLDIESVVVSGNFNNWSKNKWRMTKIDDNTYQLRKKLSDFTDEFSWEFKFVINNELWAEPSNRFSNVERATRNGQDLNVYNLRLFTAHPDKKGNVRFRLRGFEDAKKVIVSGTFNRWDEKLFRMYKITDGWEIILQLSPNVYEYRFIVDGNWMADPTNPDKVSNEFGEYNSRVDVQKRVSFQLHGFEHANKVILTGDFNDWNEHNFEMTKSSDGTWHRSLPLSGGKYHYKFIVDGEWVLDPDNTVKEYDGNGHINSVCIVK